MLAFLQAEPGGEMVRDLLERASDGQVRLFFSIINVGEVYYLLPREQGADRAEQFFRDLSALPLQLLDASEARVLSARLKAQHPIAYADAFAAALAVELRARLVTGDPEFQSVAGDVDVLWLPAS